MKRVGVDGGFIACFLINLALNWSWTIPAWIALVLHYATGISLLWFAILIAAWFVGTFIVTLVLSHVASMPGANDAKRLTPEQQKAKDERIREISRSVGQKK